LVAKKRKKIGWYQRRKRLRTMLKTIDEVSCEQKVTAHAGRHTVPVEHQRSTGSLDERFYLELFRHALVDQTDQAWAGLQQCFSATIRRWLQSHPSRDVALRQDSAENYVAQTFARFWSAVHHQEIEFTSLPAALSYMRATLNGLIMDTVRAHLRQRAREVPLPEPGWGAEPFEEEASGLEEQQMWESIGSLLADERERRLAYLIYHCGLKPREIVLRCPQEFADVKEVYRLNHNVVERLRRNRDRLRHSLGMTE
jgi:hypothetical protein